MALATSYSPQKILESETLSNMQVYGADMDWKQLGREAMTVARCTVERLMRRLGLRGVVRVKVMRNTISDGKAPCPLDRVIGQLRV